jgi:hypothetical protein
MEKAKQNPAQTLMQGVGFTQDDLEANREGRMTGGQRIRLMNLQKGRIPWSALLKGPALVVILSLGGALITRSEYPNPFLGLLVTGGIYFGFMFLIWLSEYRRMSHFRHDLADNQISEVEGRIQLLAKNTYAASMEGIRFSLEKPAFLAFKNGDPYRLYYTPRSKTLLSAEWLQDNEA